MTLCLTNTMKRTKEPFAPANPDHVTMYVCGPTVYNFAHIGNARPAVVFDVLYRLLKRRFGRVVYARNFTDVDDKINAAAKESRSSSVSALANQASGSNNRSMPTILCSRLYASTRRDLLFINSIKDIGARIMPPHHG